MYVVFYVFPKILKNILGVFFYLKVYLNPYYFRNNIEIFTAILLLFTIYKKDKPIMLNEINTNKANGSLLSRSIHYLKVLQAETFY